jgi:hypothetical protein
VLRRGTTFIRIGHIWFNITEPSPESPLVLCVNFTALDDECPDDECPISRAEYRWVKDDYPTTVAFSRARLWNANSIEKCLKTGELRKPRQGDVPPRTVLKVIRIAITSRELNGDVKLFLK